MPRRKGSLNKNTTRKVLTVLIEGPLHIREIHRRTGLRLGTIIHVLNVLEQRGWVISWKEKNRKVFDLTPPSLYFLNKLYIEEVAGVFLSNAVLPPTFRIMQDITKKLEIRPIIENFETGLNSALQSVRVLIDWFKNNEKPIEELEAEARKDGFSFKELPLTKEIIEFIETYKRNKEGFYYLRNRGVKFFEALFWAKDAQMCLSERKLKTLPFSQRRVERRKRLFEIPEGYQPTLYPLNQNVSMRTKQKKIEKD